MSDSIVLLVNGTTVTCDQEDKNYYLGEIAVGETSYHVEAVEVKVMETSSGGVKVKALNKLYQERITAWEKRNDGMTPGLVELDGKSYFVEIQVYAA